MSEPTVLDIVLESLNQLRAKSDQILEQVLKTNGKVTTLERDKDELKRTTEELQNKIDESNRRWHDPDNCPAWSKIYRGFMGWMIPAMIVIIGIVIGLMKLLKL